jgi:hypothetical protein
MERQKAKQAKNATGKHVASRSARAVVDAERALVSGGVFGPFGSLALDLEHAASAAGADVIEEAASVRLRVAT